MSMHGFGARLKRRDTQGLLSMLKWVSAENGDVPVGGIEVGLYDGIEGNYMYIGRITVDETEDVIPGTIIPSKGACFAAYRGTEISSTTYEALINTQPHLCEITWTAPSLDFSMPRHAVKGGIYKSSNNDVLYIARARPPGAGRASGLYVCKIRDGDLTAVMSYQGAMHKVEKDFKILCVTEAKS